MKLRSPALTKLEINMLIMRKKYLKNMGLINHGNVKYVMLSSTSATTSVMVYFSRSLLEIP
jgi:hypothetical protein